MVAPHPIKAFNEEVESAVRKCLFCNAVAPDMIDTNNMTYRKTASNAGWYSNAGLKNGIIARFYLCPRHRYMTDEAWEWVREGFVKK